MKRIIAPFAAALMSGALLLTSVPALAADAASSDRCLRVTGRQLDRCISINNKTRIRLRAATLETKSRAQLRRADRVVSDRKEDPDNILDRVEGLDLDKLRQSNAAQGSVRRKLKDAISTAQSKCVGKTGILKATCMREAFRADISE